MSVCIHQNHQRFYQMLRAAHLQEHTSLQVVLQQ